jgi:VanZ family protein
MPASLRKPSGLVIAGRVIFTLCLVGTVCFIFSNSMAVADVSSVSSGRMLALLQRLFTRLHLPGVAARLTQHIVRKIAHFCEYMLEGFWLMLCLRVYTRRFVRHISWPILGALLTALCDETIQLFSDGRSAQISDVWLDFAGSLCGLLVGLLVLCLARMCVILWEHRND